MNSFTGLPAHPLLVHLPVVMLPLAALGVVVMLARRTWYDRYRWAVLVVAAFGTLGAILAASSGEGLEQQIRAKDGAAAVQAIHDHTQAGDLARNLAIAFFIALAAYVLVPWLLDRRAPTAEENPTTDVLEPSLGSHGVDGHRRAHRHGLHGVDRQSRALRRKPGLGGLRHLQHKRGWIGHYVDAFGLSGGRQPTV